MSPITTSPGATGEQRKFINPTPGFVGANVFGADGKPTAIPVEPGGEVWLTAAEERMTAEAPRAAEDNPFIAAWEEAVEWDSNGEVIRYVPRQGVLVLSDEPPRPVASARFIPGRGSLDELRATREAMEGLSQPPPEVAAADESAKDGDHETVTGAPPQPEQPPVQGQPSPNEVIGTPGAVEANDEALARREATAEQPTRTTGLGPLPTE